MAAAVLLTVIFAALSNALALLTRQQETLIGDQPALSLPLTFLSSAIMDPSLMPRLDPDRRALQPARLGGPGQPRGAVRHPGLGRDRLAWGALVVLAVVMSWLATRAFGAYQRSV